MFGQVLGIGSFGLIREAAYIPTVNSFKASESSLKPYRQNSLDGIMSVFDNPSIETFAIKSLKKKQENINLEIMNLIKI